MKQIKTIKDRLDNAEAFDKAVNSALREGWQLTKREVIRPAAQPTNGAILHSILYAELEHEEITEDERGCENCRYFSTPSCSEPCLSCDEECSKWEELKR